MKPSPKKTKEKISLLLEIYAALDKYRPEWNKHERCYKLAISPGVYTQGRSGTHCPQCSIPKLKKILHAIIYGGNLPPLGRLRDSVIKIPAPRNGPAPKKSHKKKPVTTGPKDKVEDPTIDWQIPDAKPKQQELPMQAEADSPIKPMDTEPIVTPMIEINQELIKSILKHADDDTVQAEAYRRLAK